MNDAQKTDWNVLFRIAASLIDQVNKSDQIIENWTFGGGTAMMLQIHHRTSHDVDIFIDDPQVLPLLNPETQGYTCEIVPSGYGGDGHGFLKIAFADIGEIDFIVSAALTENPTYLGEIDGRSVAIETIAEIITKKIFYRGTAIKARDIFDIAAASQKHRDEILAGLRPYKDRTAAALAQIQKLNPEFVSKAISQLAIFDEYKEIAGDAQKQAIAVLSAL